MQVINQGNVWEPFPWLSESLACVTSQHGLEEFHLKVRDWTGAYGADHMQRLRERPMWKILDSLLSRSVFSKLRRVTIKLGIFYAVPSDSPDRTHGILAQMPLLNERGVLEIKVPVKP